jgi:hypothetical protein
MKTVIAKNEGRNIHKVTVVKDKFDPWKTVPYGQTHLMPSTNTQTGKQNNKLKP